MRKRNLLLLIIGISIFSSALSQNPFKSLGIPDEDVKVLTLSKGKYQEFHEDNEFERVGSAVINMQTKKIAYFINRDTLITETVLEPEIASRFISIDPHASKYPEWSPYVYVMDNPLKYIDPDGRDVELVIGKPYTKNGKEHPYGHVALRVHGDGYDYVYDFGRYGKVWGIGGSKGEGILNLYSDGQKYLKSEQGFRESVGFNLTTTAEQDQQIIDYFQNLANEGEKTNTGAVPGGGGTAYKLKDDYNVFDNNCTTKSAEGLEQIGGNHVGNEYDPREVLENIENNFKEMGFTKKTVYLEGGGTKVVYERQPLPKPRQKEQENHY